MPAMQFGREPGGYPLMDDRSSGVIAAPALLLDNVVKTYGPIRAVDGVSLVARPGEFIALLGPNGAGKSTLFQLLSRSEEHTSELQSHLNLVCRLLLEKKKNKDECK